MSSGALFSAITKYVSSSGTELFDDGNMVLIGSMIAMILLMLIAAAMSLTYVILIYIDISSESVLKNTTNIQTVKYTASNACDISFGGRYSFIVFPILGILFTLICVSTWFFIYNKMGGLKNLNSTRKSLLYLFTFHSFIFVSMIIVLYATSYESIAKLSKKISTLNLYICDNMYTTDTDFINALRIIPTNSVQLGMHLEKAICELVFNIELNDSTVTSDEISRKIARAFYTLNMYRHILKIGLKNELLGDALSEVFNQTNIFLFSVRQKSWWLSLSPIEIPWSPFAYFPSKVSMIVDYSDDYIQMITSNNDKSAKYKSMLDLCVNARSYCNQWTTETAEMAMEITNDDQSSNAMGSFYNMLIVWFIITWLPFLFIGFNWYTYYTKYMLDNPIKPSDPLTKSPIDSSIALGVPAVPKTLQEQSNTKQTSTEESKPSTEESKTSAEEATKTPAEAPTKELSSLQKLTKFLRGK